MGGGNADDRPFDGKTGSTLMGPRDIRASRWDSEWDSGRWEIDNHRFIRRVALHPVVYHACLENTAVFGEK